LRRPRIIIFDMDGVITKIKNSWRYLHQYFNSRLDESYDNFSKKLLEKYLKKEISYTRWITCDIEYLLRNSKRKIHRKDIYDAYSKVEIYDEIKSVIKISLENNVKIFSIVSGGVSILARIVAEKLSISEIYANHLLFDEKGYLIPAGLPIVEPLGKDEVIKKLLNKLGIDENETIFIGDSIWDIPAFNIVGYPIILGCKECLYNSNKRFDIYSAFKLNRSYDDIIYVDDHLKLIIKIKDVFKPWENL